MEETIKNNFELSPSEYFEQVKERKNHITDEDLRKVYDNCLELLNKYKITGQKKGMRKLMFHLECIENQQDTDCKRMLIFLTGLSDTTFDVILLFCVRTKHHS